MAISFSSDAQLVFFTKLFGPSHTVTQRAKALLGVGVTFEVGLYTVQAFKEATSLGVVTLTYGTTALMKGHTDLLVMHHNKSLIEGWIDGLYAKQGSPTVATAPITLTVQGLPLGTILNKLVLIKALKQVTGVEKKLSDAKAWAEAILDDVTVTVPVTAGMSESSAIAILTAVGVNVKKAGGPVVSPKTPAPVAPVDAVIALKQAQALGQKVHGTSQHSVYRTIAVGEHVKVAAKLLAGGLVSIRAEWTDNPTADLKKLEEAGVEMKGTYGSIHFDAAGVPVARIVGAFLVGTGINWKAAVMNGADLVMGGI